MNELFAVLMGIGVALLILYGVVCVMEQLIRWWIRKENP